MSYKNIKWPVGKVELPEFGTFYIRTLSLAELESLVKLAEADQQEATLKAVLIGACDESGKREFGDDDKDVVTQLPTKLILTVATELLKYNSITSDVLDDAKKNLETIPS